VVIREVPANSILDQLDGETIASHYVEDEEGLHICFQSGRILVIGGFFAISLLQQDRKDLH